MAVINRIKAALFVILIYLSSFLGIMFFAGWSLPLVFINSKMFRPVMDFHVGFWFDYAAVS